MILAVFNTFYLLQEVASYFVKKTIGSTIVGTEAGNDSIRFVKTTEYLTL